jgi:SAM-dependent methyltransferase
MAGVSFDPVADAYDATRRLPGPLMDRAVAALADALGEGPSLEVGVGTGRFAAPLSRHGVRVVGADISPRMLANARAKGCRDLFLASGTALPFRDGAFRGSMAIHVLHLVAAWRDVLGELARVTTDRFVTLFETITTRPLDGGEPSAVHGDALAWPMGRYQELARPRGYGYAHPGIRPPDMVARAPPSLRVPAGAHRLVLTAEDILAPIAAKTLSSQWHVPDPVHAEIMAQLRRESAGNRFERTWDIEVVAWSPEDLLRM